MLELSVPLALMAPPFKPLFLRKISFVLGQMQRFPLKLSVGGAALNILHKSFPSFPCDKIQGGSPQDAHLYQRQVYLPRFSL
jgi:hypothetical protein